LFGGKWTDFRTVDDERADWLIVLAHWDSDQGARATVLGSRAATLFGQFIGRVNEFLCVQQAAQGSISIRAKRLAFSKRFFIFGCDADPGCRMKLTVVTAEQNTKLGLTNLHRFHEHRLEDRRQLTGRRADDFEHVGGGSLLV